MRRWFLESEVKRVMMEARSGLKQVSAEEQKEFLALYNGNESRIMVIAGSNAEIVVSGILTQSPDYWALYYGGGNTTYPEIIQALRAADSDPNVDRIKMVMESPGGEIAGLLECIAAMDATSKPIDVVVPNIAASAAYALISHANTVTAKNRATRVGCIGIMVEMGINDGSVKISNTEAPKKCPDVATEEGKAIVREELDAIYQVFIETIATGRGTTVETINAKYGQGATLLAEEALKRGMIDAIESSVTTASTLNTHNAREGYKPEANKMDLKTLKAQHPDVYAEAVQDGITTERDRVSAHLIMGEASGSVDVAIKAVKDGTAMNATLTATYMAAGMNKKNIQARAQDESGAGAVADGTEKPAATPVAGSEVMGIIEAKLGTKVKA